MTGSTLSTTRLLIAALLAALLALWLPGAARAAFPGQNGPIVGTQYGFLTVDYQAVVTAVGSWRDARASSDGTRIFAVHVPDEGAPAATAGVWSLRRDGTDRVQITESPADGDPAPFPGGARIVVTSGGDLWSVPVRPADAPGPGSGRTLLFRSETVRAANPEVSPDGRRVAFDATDAWGGKDVWTLDVATLKARRMVGAMSDDEDPSWSPDGARIAFASNRAKDRTWNVFAIDATSGAVVGNLTAAVAGDKREPAWSPDGTELAFRLGGSEQVRAVTLASGRDRYLHSNFESPDWAVAATVTPPGALPCTIVVKPQAGIATVQGTADRDVICGGAGPERIDGAGGNDVIRAGGGADEIDGGAGDDWIDGGAGDDRLDGGHAGDVLRGGAGTDTVTYERRVDDVTVNVPGWSGSPHEGDLIVEVEAAVGGAGDDVLASYDATPRSLSGGAGDDRLYGSAADDRLEGGAGDDVLFAIAGDDLLDGGDGGDRLDGGEGADTLVGGAGDDALDGGIGGDRFEGGDGADTVTYERRSAPVAVTPGDGVANDGEAGEEDSVSFDVERLTGGSGDDRLVASEQVEGTILTGGLGDDVLTGGPFAEDLLLGGPGADVLDVSADGGADRALCGSDAPERELRDVAIVDGADLAGADCEVVRGPA